VSVVFGSYERAGGRVSVRAYVLHALRGARTVDTLRRMSFVFVYDINKRSTNDHTCAKASSSVSLEACSKRRMPMHSFTAGWSRPFLRVGWSHPFSRHTSAGALTPYDWIVLKAYPFM
jgi:hypothetical protein